MTREDGRYAPPDEDMRYRLPGEIETYWRAVRGERLVPLRSEIDPRGFEGALDHAFILERTAPMRTKFRLAGLWLTDAFGMEMRGMPATALFVPDQREAAAGVIDRVFTGPEILRMQVCSAGRSGGEILYLPLRSDLGDTTRALGCVGAPSRPDLAESRFSITGMERTDIMGSTAQVGALAEPRVPFEHAPRRGHLRLVKG